MSVTLALVVGGLTSVGVYLITSRSLTRMLLGFALLGHAAVVALLAAGGEAGERPADPTRSLGPGGPPSWPPWPGAPPQDPTRRRSPSDCARS